MKERIIEWLDSLDEKAAALRMVFHLRHDRETIKGKRLLEAPRSQGQPELLPYHAL